MQRMGGSLLHSALQPESDTPEDSPLLQVQSLPDASRRCAFQVAIRHAEVARASRLIMNNCFPQARCLTSKSKTPRCSTLPFFRIVRVSFSILASGHPGL